MAQLGDSLNPALALKAPWAARWMALADYAPSGGNARPWLLTNTSTPWIPSIRISIDSEYGRSPSPMDLDGSASVFALGCLAKTLQCAAEIDGFSTQFHVAESGDDLWAAEIDLQFHSQTPGRFAYDIETIKRRRTHRYRYARTSLDPGFLERLHFITNSHSGLKLLDFSSDRQKLLSPLIQLERVRWQNARYLDGLFHEINFATERQPSARGIWIGDLGLSRADLALFHLLHRIPSLRRVLNPMLRQIAPQKSIEDLVTHSGGLFFLQVATNDVASISAAGSAFQDIWLSATQLGLLFQPVSPTLIAYNYVHQQERGIFSKGEADTILTATQELVEQFGLTPHLFNLGFRIGRPASEE